MGGLFYIKRRLSNVNLIDEPDSHIGPWLVGQFVQHQVVVSYGPE